MKGLKKKRGEKHICGFLIKRIGVSGMLFVSLLLGCVAPFDIPIIEAEPAIFIDASFTTESKSHFVKIFQTNSLDDSRAFKGVTRAIVWVEELETNTRIDYLEAENGIYISEGSQCGNVGRTYILNIEMQDGAVIRSNPEKIPSLHFVDDIHWSLETVPSETNGFLERGIQFFANTKSIDETDIYARYDIFESYAFEVALETFYAVSREFNPIPQANGELLPLELLTESVKRCYRNSQLSQIELATSSGKTRNEIPDFPITFVAERTNPLGIEYNLTIKQNNINSAAYAYFKLLKEQNESSGSLFDAQRGNLIGNLFLENDQQSILGYFEVASVSTLSKSFHTSEFKNEGYVPRFPVINCIDSLIIPFDGIYDFFYGSDQGANSLYLKSNIDEYNVAILDDYHQVALITNKECTNCIDAGGTLELPPF